MPSSAGLSWVSLSLLSLVLITVSFRSSALDGVQGTASERVCGRSRSPPTVSRGRSATPPAGRTGSSTRRARTQKLRTQVDDLRRQVILERDRAAGERGAEAPSSTTTAPPSVADFKQVPTAVLANPLGAIDQSVDDLRRLDATGSRTAASSSSRLGTTAGALVGSVDRVFSERLARDAAHRRPERRRPRPTSPHQRASASCRARQRRQQRARSSTACRRRRTSASATRSSPPARSAAGALPSMFPRGIPIGSSRARATTTSTFQEHPGAAVRRLLVAPVGDRARPEGDSRWTDVQGRARPLRRRAPPARLCSPSIARSARRASCSSRCSRSRSCAARSSARSPASATGLLLDTATLGTLGFTSLLLTLAGFWIGRYGETTARDRFHAPFLSVAVVTVLYAFGQLALQFVLGEPAPAGLVADGLPAALLLNLILTLPVYALARRLFPPRRARRPRPRGAAPWLSDVRGRGRFLPGDPRVEEPYRLTPQLALRVAILGFVALARLRRALPAPLGAAGALGRRGTSRRRTTTACARCSSRRRAGRSSTATGTCSSRTSPGTSLELWPADLPKTLARRAGGAARRSSIVTGIPVDEIVARDEARTAATR